MLEFALIGISTGIAVVATLLAWRLHARLAASHAELQASIEQLREQQQFQKQSISGLTSGALGMDRRLRRAEAAGRVLDEQQQTLANQQATEQPYSHAIRLVQQGASTRRLMDELGLSESEAELIVQLHGLRDSA